MPSTSPLLPTDILAILRCPWCRGKLSQHGRDVLCPSCGRVFPWVNGTVRFVSEQYYADTFGFQWHRYARTQLDTADHQVSENDFRQRTGFTPQELSGKLVLDVGCGMGRFAEVASRWGARVVAVDLSTAAEVAARNLVDRRSVVVFQADAFALPFAPESFDYVYSLGVLHHTPDCEAAFKGLTRFLKPGGTIAIWVYSGYNKWYRFSDLYRKVTHRLPAPWLHGLCRVFVPFGYYGYHAIRWLPLAGHPMSGLFHHIVPVSLQPDRDSRVLDTFDWYSPKYQSKHTYEEVFRWFEDCGLDSLRVLYESVSVRGRKPVRVSESAVEKELSLAAGGT